MNAKRMIPLLMLLTVGPCAVHGADSIVISGGRRSIIISGRAPEPVQAIVSVPSVEPQKGSDPPSTSPVVAVDQSRDAQHAAGEVSIRLQQWGATWCPSCPGGKAQAQKAADQLGVRLEYFDYDANKELARSLGVDSVPRTFVVVDGKIRHRYVGQTPSSTIVAKARELVSGTYELPPARAQPVVRKRLPVVQTQWGTIDLETYQRNCNCPMCQGIRALQQQYRQTALTPDVPAEQQPTPAPAITSMLRLMHLSSSDVLADIGCGDGRILIEAVRQYGCRGVGIEIDPEMANRARAAVTAAGLSGQITIITGDAKNFRPEDHEVTAATVYLYPELLAELEPMLKRIPIVGSPYHQIASLPQTKHGDIWIYRKGTPSRTATTWRSRPPQRSGIIVTACRRCR